ncbi:MAG: aldolase/citrate lyase family protein [Candidatus Melainabacteria bacterium]|nr:aldolase/citrate lyase family protein [Candidatus Melainabacteria bacterium]
MTPTTTSHAMFHPIFSSCGVSAGISPAGTSSAAPLRPPVAKRPQIGTLVSLACDAVAEIVATSGLDWVWLDMEHSALGLAETQRLIQLMSPHVPVLVRVPDHRASVIHQVLDFGASGIIAPQVKTAEEALAIVRACYYPPLGNRSVGIGRAQGYGYHLPAYVAHANQHVAVLLQIEHVDALDHLPEILSTPGLGGIIIGPYDLSGSLHLLGEVHHATVQTAIASIRQQCQQANVPVGLFMANHQTLAQTIAQGYQLLAVGSDTLFMAQATHDLVQHARAALASRGDT